MKFLTKLMDTIVMLMICAVILAGVVAAVEFRNAPTEEHYELTWTVTDGIDCKRIEVKDMSGTLTQETMESIQAGLGNLLNGIDKALN